MRQYYPIRRAESSDIDSVAQIEREVFSDPWSASAFRQYLGAVFPVAISAEGPVGYALARVAGSEAEILSIGVGRRHQRRGVASALLEFCLNSVAQLGAEEVFLEVRESNDPARDFYRKFGFLDIGVRKGYYEKPRENAVVMYRQILPD